MGVEEETELEWNKIYPNAILAYRANNERKGLGRVLLVKPTRTPHEAKYAILFRFRKDVSYYIFNEYELDEKGLVIINGKRKTLSPEKVMIADKFMRENNYHA